MRVWIGFCFGKNLGLDPIFVIPIFIECQTNSKFRIQLIEEIATKFIGKVCTTLNKWLANVLWFYFFCGKVDEIHCFLPKLETIVEKSHTLKDLVLWVVMSISLLLFWNRPLQIISNPNSHVHNALLQPINSPFIIAS